MRTDVIGPGILIVTDESISSSGMLFPQECSVIRSKDDIHTVMSIDRSTLPIFTSERVIELFMRNHGLRMERFKVYTYRSWDALIEAYTGRGIENVHVDPTGLEWIPVNEIPFCKSAELVG